MKTSDRLTPLRHQRAEGDTSLGTKANPVVTSSNRAVAKFARGGSVKETTMKGKSGAKGKAAPKGAPMKKGAPPKFAKGGSVKGSGSTKGCTW